MTIELTPQEIEAIKKEAESILKITYIHHTTEVNPDDNWADWETCKNDGTVEMVLEAMTKQATSALLKHKAEIQAYRFALNNLVQLKKWKDEHGRDQHYREVQPEAWVIAEQTLNQFK